MVGFVLVNWAWFLLRRFFMGLGRGFDLLR